MAATSVEAECEREPPAKRSKAVDAQSAAAAAEDDDGDAEIAIELDDSADVDASPNAGASPPALTAHMLEEEASLAEARAAEDAALHRAQAAEHKAISKPAIAAKVRRLNELLEKSIVYSEFLANKLKNPTAHVQLVKGDGGAESGTGAGKSVGLVTQGMGKLPQPEAISGGQMRDYQLVGVHWLTGLYENGLNGILGDEMGLGKTVQTIGFLAFLRERGTHGPFLIAGPLSTIGNWHNEFKKWAPTIPSVVYHGSKEERAQIRSEAMRHPGNPAFPVVITSYEIILRDFADLRRIPWKFLIVDEGHRLKNLNCQLIQRLKSLNSANRLLLSGTPLQNNLKELWSLLNFLLPDIFDDLESFQSWFDFDVTGDEGSQQILKREEEAQVVTKLHLILRPFLLRRLKADVDLSIPPKHEYILYCELTQQQRDVYVAVLERELVTAKGSLRLQNVLMQLRKVCNHPYLFDWPTDEQGEEQIDERIVSSSAKMVLLDRIMTRLRAEGGHQTLIFSQMTTQLDILQDYCTLRGFSFERLDGSVTNVERLEAMERFNKGGVDVFLLSTRAGGLGINLVAADTCIIYDSDWNPHADLQAQDRCHRIGQKEVVLIFRLTTTDTVEEQVLKAAKDKLKLEQLVISRGKYKMVGEKTDRDEKLKKRELINLLAYDPSKSALGRGADKTITDDELAIVLERRAERATDKGHGFAPVEAVVSKFDQTAKETGDASGVDGAADAVAATAAQA